MKTNGKVDASISLPDQNCLARFHSNPMMGRTSPDGQNIPGNRDLLINEETQILVRCKKKNEDNFYFKKNMVNLSI